jgi:hypothetical protein
MKTTVQILNRIFPGIALGINSFEKKIYVMHGDLKMGEECLVEITENKGILEEFNYDLDTLTEKYGDKDKLIHANSLIELKQSRPLDRIFEINGNWCFPDYSIRHLLEISIENGLLSNTRLKISKTRYKSISRANYFGLDFINAINKTIEKGIEVSYYYCAEKKEWSHMGGFADYLIKLNINKDKNIEFNAWQAIGDENTLFYVHGIIEQEKKWFIHIDFAYHHTEIEEIAKLFLEHKKKPILLNKEKLFRIDGKISIEIGFDLIRTFFPLSELATEYYNVEHG